MTAGNKILKNTMVLYVRMFISLIVGLVSTRIVLGVIGVEDYGIYSLIVGVIAMITFINSAMSGTTQRFLSFNLGKSDKSELPKYFQTSFLIHFGLGSLIVILLTAFGPQFLRQKLNIPVERLDASIILFYFVLIYTFFSIICSPFDGSISSNEDFTFIAFTELFISVSNLGSAILISYIGNDKLILYGFLTTASMIIVSFWKIIYCKRKYAECKKVVGKPDKSKLKEMLSFAGWNVFGAGAALARGQGIAVIINLFHGVIVNAAYGIANQINGQLQSFASVISRAIYPQLTQSEGGGDRERMFKLTVISSKLAFMLMAIIAIPLFAEMELILTIWLKNVPEHAVIFTQLTIVFILISSLSNGLVAAVQSIGKIKLYQSVAGSLLILGLPVTYVVFKYGAEAYYALVMVILFELITHIFRLAFLYKTANFNMKHYLIDVDLKLLITTGAIYIAVYIPSRMIASDWLRLGSVIIASSTAMLITGYYFLSNSEEKQRIQFLANQLILRKKTK